MVKGKFYSGQDDLSAIMKIRKTVFQQELGQSEQEDVDGQDVFCMHVLAYAEDEPVAVGRISYDGWEFVIGKVAVLRSYRGKKYGDFIVRMLVDKALMANAKEIKLESAPGTVGFFETIGFRTAASDNAAKGSAVPMILKAEDIHSCCGCK